MAAVTVSAPTGTAVIERSDVAHWTHLRKDALGVLIRSAWIEGEARERNVVVTARQVRERLRGEPRGELPRADLVWRTRIRMLDEAMREPVLTAAALGVTQAQIDAYVAAHPKFQPARRSVYVMRLHNRRTAQQALAALRRGLSLKSATKRYAHKRTGLVLARPGQIDPEGLDRKIFKAEPGTYSRYGTVVFKVRTIEAPQPLPADQQSAQA